VIQQEDQGDVLVLRMQHGKVNALDLELLRALAEGLEELAVGDTRPVVLTGTGSAFSAGVDLKRIVDGGAQYAAEFLPALDRAFESVLHFPRPLIAAINGHAIAGGCILACASDRRVLARGKARIGAPELRVGVAWPVLAIEILRAGVRHECFREMVYGGKTYLPEEALEVGLVDELVDADQLLARALEVARDLASLPPVAFRLAKRQIAAPIPSACAAAADRETEVRADWAAPATHARLRRYLEQLSARSGS
jgi:enoyl-CoA hydratase